MDDAAGAAAGGAETMMRMRLKMLREMHGENEAAAAAAMCCRGRLTLPVVEPATNAGGGGVIKQVLERYLGRLVATEQLAAGAGVLRRELDRSPNDPHDV